MRIAFYAPMKPPTHPVPSGDRRVARLLMQALRAGGHEIVLASRLRAWSAGDDPRRTQRIRHRGEQTARRLIDRWRHDPGRPMAWFTYHLYHKAPDWIGPKFARTLDIPYLVAEASHAPKQANGPWADGFLAAEQALRQASAIFALSADDEEGLRRALGPDASIQRLPPFLDARPYVRASKRRAMVRRTWLPEPTEGPWLLAVGMMRAGDKQASYDVLAEAMKRPAGRDWRLAIVGFGPAADAILAKFDPARTHHFGKLKPGELAELYAAADLFVWPAVNEAFGMALLEAQAAGLPVVAGGGRGVPDIVEDGRTGLLTPTGDAQAFADAVAELLDDPQRRRDMGAAAQRHVLANHDLGTATAKLNAALRDATA